MKKLLVLAAGILGLWATQANAATMLDIGDSNELGTYAPGTPNGDQFTTAFVDHLRQLDPSAPADVYQEHLFDRSSHSFSPLDPAVFIQRIDLSVGANIEIPAGGAEYLAAKYAGGRPGHGGVEVWYIGGMSGLITIPDFWTPAGEKFGLSDITFLTPLGGGGQVPDGGLTVLLLGSALMGLGMLRNRFSSK